MLSQSSPLTTIKQFLQDKLLFGNKPSFELFAILTVYFVQGILGLARLAVSFFLKDTLGLNPAQVAALMGISALPWIIKPLFGFLSDGLPIFGYRRRSYLIISGILGAFSWITLATVVNSPWSATLAILLTSLSVAISDVIADSIVVERARKESLGKAGSLQSLMWAVSALGGLITAYLSGWLLESFTTETVFLITAFFPLIVSAIAGWIVEDKTTIGKDQPSKIKISEQIKQLWWAVKQKYIWLPTAFIFLWQITPNADSAFFFFTTNELGFKPEFLGRVRLFTSLAALFGAWLYHRFLKSIPFRTILGWSVVFSSLLGMTTLLLVTHINRNFGIDDHWFSIGDSIILTVMGQIAFMPVLVLSARLCPEGIEASLFALLMSIFNLAGLLSNELGALLTHVLGVTERNFDQLWLLILICNLSSLLPLIFLKWLPTEDPQYSKSVSNLPPAELFEHHTTGSLIEQSFLPDVLPELIKTGNSKS
jgi:folate/biopterin transporter